MKRLRNCTLIFACWLCVIGPSPAFAEQALKIAFGDALPPWVIPHTNTGILLDILKETLEPAGYTLSYVYVPYARRLKIYENGDVDAVCDVNPKVIAEAKLTGHLSVLAYAYENIGVSLKRRGFRFSTISDLTGYRVVAWQGAKDTIGGEYAEMASKNTRYRELPNQQLQIRLLYAGRADVIQLDRQIFQYFRTLESHEDRVDTRQPIDIFPLFGKNECGFLFKDKKVQVTFDTHFERLKESGRYDEIFEKYTQ